MRTIKIHYYCYGKVIRIRSKQQCTFFVAFIRTSWAAPGHLWIFLVLLLFIFLYLEYILFSYYLIVFVSRSSRFTYMWPYKYSSCALLFIIVLIAIFAIDAQETFFYEIAKRNSNNASISKNTLKSCIVDKRAQCVCHTRCLPNWTKTFFSNDKLLCFVFANKWRRCEIYKVYTQQTKQKNMHNPLWQFEKF